MKNDIVKDNVLIQASYKLTLAEQRLILLAIIEARNNGLTLGERNIITIHANSYAKQYNIDISTAYKVVEDARAKLKDREILYKEINTATGKPTVMVEKWLDKYSHKLVDGAIQLRFSEVVLKFITQLDSHFTKYDIANVSELTSGYAIRLYELIIQWRDKGFTQKYSIDDLRDKLGVDKEQYKELYNFKIRVIDIALKQINKHTDLKVTYKQYKKGRTVTDFSFHFTIKKPAKIKDVKQDKPFTMSDKQLKYFSAKLSGISIYHNKVTGNQSYEDLAKLIAKELQDTDKQKQYSMHLEQLGFKVA